MIHQRRRHRIEPLRIVDDNDQVLVLLQGSMRGGQHRGGLSWSVDSHGPIERAQRHGGAGLGAQHIPHRQPAGLDSHGQGASQCRFADPAIAHQRDALKLRVVPERRQRLTNLVIAAHQRPTRPALPWHTSAPLNRPFGSEMYPGVPFVGGTRATGGSPSKSALQHDEPALPKVPIVIWTVAETSLRMSDFSDKISACFRRSLWGSGTWTFGRRSEEAEAAPAGPHRQLASHFSR